MLDGLAQVDGGPRRLNLHIVANDILYILILIRLDYYSVTHAGCHVYLSTDVLGNIVTHSIGPIICTSTRSL